MTNAYQSPVPARLSKSSLFSLILGILVCIPFGGVLAMLLGGIGFFMAGKPGMKGRWMAVVGGILGLGSTITWVLCSGAIIAVIFAAVGIVKPALGAGHDFIRDLAAGDVATVKAHNPALDEAQLKQDHDTLVKKGTFVDTAFPTVDLPDQNNCHLAGTAKFTNGSFAVDITLVKNGDSWQVKSYTIKDQ